MGARDNDNDDDDIEVQVRAIELPEGPLGDLLRGVIGRLAKEAAHKSKKSAAIARAMTDKEAREHIAQVDGYKPCVGDKVVWNEYSSRFYGMPDGLEYFHVVSVLPSPLYESSGREANKEPTGCMYIDCVLGFMGLRGSDDKTPCAMEIMASSRALELYTGNNGGSKRNGIDTETREPLDGKEGPGNASGSAAPQSDKSSLH